VNSNKGKIETRMKGWRRRAGGINGIDGGGFQIRDIDSRRDSSRKIQGLGR